MDSPYRQHLDTNYVPSGDEGKHIRAILESYDKEILDIDTQVTMLKQQLDALQEKRANIHAFSERHRALLSPMRKFAHEFRDVLEEIFLACIQTERNPCISATEAPMLLTHVCSSWRKIALSTPRLWERIHIALPNIKKDGNENDLFVKETRVQSILELREAAVYEWFSRSYTRPLSISVYQFFPSPIPGRSALYTTICENIRKMHLSFICDIIIPQHKRWKDIDIFLTDDTLRGFLDSGLTSESLQNLEKLHVTRQTRGRWTSDLEVTPYRWWQELLALMPLRTTSATFYNFPIHCFEDVRALSSYAWGRLTVLNLKLHEEKRSWPEGNVFEVGTSVLRHCHSLENLKLALVTDASRARSFPLPDITLQYLTTLSIMLPLTANSLRFAKLLYLPSLNDLGVGFITFDEPPQEAILPDTVQSLLRASEGCHTLRLYTQYWAPSSPSVLVQLLKITPSLRCLQISPEELDNERWIFSHPEYYHNWGYRHDLLNDHLLQALTSTSNPYADIICPKLEELVFEYGIVTGITETGLKEFVMSRQNDERVSTIRRICVVIDHPKQQQPSSTEKVSMGKDSAIYFKIPKEPIIYSPFDGFIEQLAGDVEYLPNSYNEL